MRYKVKRLPTDQQIIGVANLPLMYGVYGNGLSHCLIATFTSEAEADIFCAIKNAFAKHQ